VTTDEECATTFYPIPTGWAWAHLQDLVMKPRSDIVDGPFGSDLKASEYTDEGIPIVRLQNIDRNEFIKKNIKFIPKEKAQELNRHNFVKGDIIITKLGAPLGKACLVPDDIEHGILVADVVRLRVSEKNISKKYVLHAINSNIAAKQFEEKTKGTTRPRVNLNHIRELVIPIPPFNEQLRIVGKVEVLFSFLDAGVASLHAVQAQLKRYRQAVLKYAFEGKLTAQWREFHKEQIEPAQKIIDRLEQQIDLEDIKIANVSILPSLPETWDWVQIGSIGKVVTGNTPSKSHPEYYGNAHPFFKPTDLNIGYYTAKSTDGLSEIGIKYARVAPENSVLVTCIGATIGKTGLIRVSGAFNQQINAVIPNRDVVPEYVYFACISQVIQKSIKEKASSTTLPILNKSKFERLPFPLSSFSEQQTIVRGIERLFSIISETEITIKQEILRSSNLRQSILKFAFAGQLVNQDPADTPAEKLLERIKAERLTNKSKKQSTGVV
jgi:type I restriction enzyme, S subunit